MNVSSSLLLSYKCTHPHFWWTSLLRCHTGISHISQTREPSLSPKHGLWPNPVFSNLFGGFTMDSFTLVLPTPSPLHQSNHQILLVFPLKLFQDLARSLHPPPPHYTGPTWPPLAPPLQTDVSVRQSWGCLWDQRLWVSFTRCSSPISSLLHSTELLRVHTLISCTCMDSDLFTTLTVCLANSHVLWDFLQGHFLWEVPPIPLLPPKGLQLFPNEAATPSPLPPPLSSLRAGPMLYLHLLSPIKPDPGK